jgi:hypothetical protein
MAQAESSPRIMFKVSCPAFGKEVLMLHDTWHGHVLRSDTGHPIMKHKEDLVKRAVSNITDTRHLFRFSDYPKDTWFFDYRCPDFEKINDFLRIGFKKCAELDNEIIIATAFPVKRGVISYESTW